MSSQHALSKNSQNLGKKALDKSKVKKVFNLEDYKKNLQKFKDSLEKNPVEKKEKFKFNINKSFDVTTTVRRVVRKQAKKEGFFDNSKIMAELYNTKVENYNDDYAMINFLSTMVEYGCTIKNSIFISFKSKNDENPKEFTPFDIDLIVKTHCIAKPEEKQFITLRSYCKYLSKRYKNIIEEEINKDLKERKFFKKFNLSFLSPEDGEYLTDAFAKEIIPNWKYELIKLYLSSYNTYNTINSNKKLLQFEAFKGRLASLVSSLDDDIDNFDSKYKDSEEYQQIIELSKEAKSSKNDDYINIFDIIHNIRVDKTVSPKSDYFNEFNNIIYRYLTSVIGVIKAERDIKELTICVYIFNTLHPEGDIIDTKIDEDDIKISDDKFKQSVKNFAINAKK